MRSGKAWARIFASARRQVSSSSTQLSNICSTFPMFMAPPYVFFHHFPMARWSFQVILPGSQWMRLKMTLQVTGSEVLKARGISIDMQPIKVDADRLVDLSKAAETCNQDHKHNRDQGKKRSQWAKSIHVCLRYLTFSWESGGPTWVLQPCLPVWASVQEVDLKKPLHSMFFHSFPCLSMPSSGLSPTRMQ